MVQYLYASFSIKPAFQSLAGIAYSTAVLPAAGLPTKQFFFVVIHLNFDETQTHG